MNLAMKLGLGLEARSINAEEGDGEKSSHYLTAEQVYSGSAREGGRACCLATGTKARGP